MSPTFPEGVFGILPLDGAVGVFKCGSLKEFAAMGQGKAEDAGGQIPASPSSACPVPAAPALCHTALGQSPGKVSISHHLFFPSPFPAHHPGPASH